MFLFQYAFYLFQRFPLYFVELSNDGFMLCPFVSEWNRGGMLLR